MISYLKKAGQNERPVHDIVGLSTDTKPLDAINGSTFYEIDTGKRYLFDEEGAEWCEV